MRRTTVKLDDEVDSRVRHEAARRGMTMSEWVREAISAHLPAQGDRLPRHIYGVGIGHSGRSDISERIEELLDEDFADWRNEPT